MKNDEVKSGESPFTSAFIIPCSIFDIHSTLSSSSPADTSTRIAAASGIAKPRLRPIPVRGVQFYAV
jgi:hypothetical protein